MPTRVVSMPCVEWFDEQDEAYRDDVLPAGGDGAGVGRGRDRHAVAPVRRRPGEIVSIEHFGASADYQTLFRSSASPPTTSSPRPAAASPRRTVRNTMTSDRLADLAAAGVSIWLDDLSRERLRSGNLQASITDKHVVGVTTNPTIFAAALAHGEAYDAQVRELAERGASVEDAVREITVADVQQACDVFRDTWEATGGVDGRVSLEVDPRLARDTDATVAEAEDLWKAVDRPNLLVKIPATEAGLPAITSALAEGISVNVTLIFSVERYRAVMGAYLDGLEQAAANGQDLATIASVASFFVSRVDTEIDKRVWRRSAPTRRWRCAARRPSPTPGSPTRRSRRCSPGRAGKPSRPRAPRPQRPLWASTGVKNPDYSDTLYVSDLVVADTVNTMPEKTLLAFADHGELHPAATPSPAPPRRRRRSSTPSPPSASTSPTCSWRSRTRASTSSSSPGRSCGTPWTTSSPRPADTSRRRVSAPPAAGTLTRAGFDPPGMIG